MAVDLDRFMPATGEGTRLDCAVLRRVALRESCSPTRFAFEMQLPVTDLRDVAGVSGSAGIMLLAAFDAELDRSVERLREVHGEALAVGPPWCVTGTPRAGWKRP
jgi:hypothetical protein